MQRTWLRRPARARTGVAALVAAALLVGACGGDDDTGREDSTAPTSAGDSGDGAGELTDSFRGVTAEAIKVGFTIVDYSAIADFVDFQRGDQERVAQTLVDWINDEGGILGRRIEPVFVEYPPVPGMEPNPLSVCTRLTEDEEVFAVLGVFVDFTGDGQLCVARDHETIHIGHLIQQAWIDEAPPGLMLTPSPTVEGTFELLLRLLEAEGTLDGRTVAVLADDDSQARVDSLIVPALEDAGVELGSTAILTITGTDNTAAQGQLDGFLERWKEEGVDTVFMSGLTASAKQWVEKVKAELPDALLISDSPSVVQQGQDLVEAGVDPNPYTGTITADTQSREERWAEPGPLLQACIDAYEERTGETVLGPAEAEVDENGKTIELYVALEDFCDELYLLKLIAEAAGADLTNETWTEAVHGLGRFEMPTAALASLCEGKYSAPDQYALKEFDPTIGGRGDWSPISDYQDASGGRCT